MSLNHRLVEFESVRVVFEFNGHAMLRFARVYLTHGLTLNGLDAKVGVSETLVCLPPILQ